MLNVLAVYSLIESIRVHLLDGLVLLFALVAEADLVLHREVAALPVELQLATHVVQSCIGEVKRRPMYIFRRCTK